MIDSIIQVIDRATWSQLAILGFAIGVVLFAIIIAIRALVERIYPKKLRDFNKRYGRSL